MLQVALVAPLLSKVYNRRFISEWKTMAHDRQFGAEIVNYTVGFVICGQAPVAAMPTAVEPMTGRLRLALNVTKARYVRLPEGRSQCVPHDQCGDGSAARALGAVPEVVERLTRFVLSPRNYRRLGQASPIYVAVDTHALNPLRHWLCRNHNVKLGK